MTCSKSSSHPAATRSNFLLPGVTFLLLLIVCSQKKQCGFFGLHFELRKVEQHILKTAAVTENSENFSGASALGRQRSSIAKEIW